MDSRAAKLALARKKLKDHQEKKTIQKDDSIKSEIGIYQDNLINAVQASNSKNSEEFLITADKHQEAATLPVEDSTTESNKTGDNMKTGLTNDKQINTTEDIQTFPGDVNVTEILISNKRNLELQVYELQKKLSHLEQNHAIVINDFKICDHKLNGLQYELKDINEKYLNAMQEILLKDTNISQLNSINTSLSEENSNLLEQLEFTRTILNGKEAENDLLQSQLHNLQNQYDVIHLQMQQLTNGSPSVPPKEKTVENEKNEAMSQKICNLEQQITLMQKERDQMNLHYEHYVAELNDQLKLAIKRNEELNKEVQNLSNRENSLIEQISDMEIRIQNYNIDKKHLEMDQNASNIKVLQDNLKHVQEELNELQHQHQQLKMLYAESETKVKELSELKTAECNHDNISISKLSADMTSDKVAAQRATEQNKKLKQDMQGLEDAFVKMSKDKLELTEKLTAEKYLNRELTIKLAEVEEKVKDMQIKLKAKDEEMIRLQSNYRDVLKQSEELKDLVNNTKSTEILQGAVNIIEETSENNNIIKLENESEAEHKPLTKVNDRNKFCLKTGDAMSQLQERFLKIMEEVADLSDEKHRLEHIILQLQNETDTICEYVALYQQQRSLLKRRDEERSAQLKVFQQECGRLKCELEELSGILSRFAEDRELLSYFQIESKRIDMEKVMVLLTNLRNNSLIDPKKKNLEFSNFYPCNCCSGKLIEV
ncbi:unnamed protein product [Arctia plantaginis]|uniref:Golgin subfamily A conserved domain-containing protein n=1 Tax=Arctia plantaginis TaxID=874455 RepID=A0A8S1AU19_ARCPL|nr:unnamed protein product [Arctia plantaginis]CAB3249933.1 unnamed protein product [Arctia plantaginis]